MTTTTKTLAALVILLTSGCSTLNPWPVQPSSTSIHDEPGFAAATPDDTHRYMPPAKPDAYSAQDAKADQKYNDEMGKAVGAEQTHNFAEAREIYLQLIKSRPDCFEPFHHLGLVCDAQHKPAEAQGYYATAIRMQPKNSVLVNDLGYSYFLQGKLDKAEASIRQAVAMQPTEPRYHNNLGLVLGNQKKYDAAWQEFRIAGGDAQAFYNLAFIYGSQNNFKAAKASFQKALAIDPSNDKARRALRTFELADTDPDSLIGYESTTPDGRRWVAYDENSPPDGTNKTPSTNNNTTGPPTRTADNTHRISGHQFQPPM